MNLDDLILFDINLSCNVSVNKVPILHALRYTKCHIIPVNICKFSSSHFMYLIQSNY